MRTFTKLLDQYLAERRRYGGNPASGGLILRPFATFADAEGDERITADLFLRWKNHFGAGSTHTWAIRLSVVRGFAAWLQGIDPRTEVPPRGLIPHRQRRLRPYIYTEEEIASIVRAATRLKSRRGLRGATYATLFGLVAVTGLRIGEAVGLDDTDVDTDAAVLHIRGDKKGMSRFVPFTECTAERLRAYRDRRDRILGRVSEAFFVGENERRLNIKIAGHAFAVVGKDVGLRKRQAGRGRGPRSHDLRHTMASMTILEWFRSGRDPDREMYKLSTWLGHTDPAGTYWYIEAVPELLRLAAERGERSFTEGEAS
ncbi:MAG: tyrosine-type recombinase/integrase [Gammaproteobacteria bacterium]|nr:tyrosine-type recombinase/integrase [Gammaproteobacteria bacterium]